MYPGDYILSIDILENIIDSLKTINYNSNRVELFIPGKSISNYLGERELPPEVYVIK